MNIFLPKKHFNAIFPLYFFKRVFERFSARARGEGISKTPHKNVTKNVWP
jgi:hypothetical protein